MQLFFCGGAFAFGEAEIVLAQDYADYTDLLDFYFLIL